MSFPPTTLSSSHHGELGLAPSRGYPLPPTFRMTALLPGDPYSLGVLFRPTRKLRSGRSWASSAAPIYRRTSWSSGRLLRLCSRPPNGLLNVLGDSLRLVGAAIPLLTEGPNQRARISVLDRALHEPASDSTRAFSLLTGQIREMGYEIVVDPCGQLSHGSRRDSCLKLHITYQL